ncbi:DUF6464 domain-containing protein [Nostoc sp. DSM 114161]|jgi:hypothetical protein
MNQIERVERHNYELRLWSDAMYDIDTSQIKTLLNLVAQQLDFHSEIDANYYHVERNWRVRFEYLARQGFEQILDGSQVACANAIFLERLAHDISGCIRRTVDYSSQSWVIVRWRDGFLAGIHQAGRTSVTLILRELTIHRGFDPDRPRITIEVWNPGNATKRGDTVEIDGMLLQGECTEWREIGEEGRFFFSPNTRSVNVSNNSRDEIRITFTTSPRTPKLRAFERLSRMIELGQIEIPRSGFFDRVVMDYPRHLGDRARIEIPTQASAEITFTEPSGETFQELQGRLEVRREAIALPGLNAINAIGDTNCKYNARSRMLRCAVNPSGPCQSCQYYEKI